MEAGVTIADVVKEVKRAVLTTTGPALAPAPA